MKFMRVSSWAEVSECGRYSVSASRHGDSLGKKPPRYLFTAWQRGQTEGEMPKILLVDADAEMCRQKCREHAEVAAK